MPGSAVAGVAGSIGQGILGSRAAKKSASAQSRTADAQIAESRRQFDLVQKLLSPYVEAGNAALSAQLDLMGLGGSIGTTPTIESVWENGPSYTERVRVSPFGRGSGGDNPFKDVTKNSQIERFRVNGQMFDSREDAEAYAKANATGGVSAEDAQKAAIGKIENGAQFKSLVEQGEYGILANASATGGLRGGNTAAALGQFRPQMLEALIDKQLANYGGIAANGQSAAAGVGTAAYNTAGQVNQALSEKGAAQAGGYIGQARSWANAGSGILSTLGQASQQPGGMWARWQF